MALATPIARPNAGGTATNVTTAAFTPGAGSLLLATVGRRSGTSLPTNPTITGGGLTWTQVLTNFFDAGAGVRIRLTVAVALVGPSPASMTVNSAQASGPKTNLIVDEIPGAATSILNFDPGTQGSGDPAMTTAAMDAASWAYAVGAFGGTDVAFAAPTDFALVQVNLEETDLVVASAVRQAPDAAASWVTGNQNSVGALMEIAPLVVAPAAVPRGQSIFIG